MRSHFIVGLFVSLALAIVLSFTIWLTGRQGSEPLATYSMYFRSDVSGLMMGGPVFYLGVEVGTVTRMEIIPGDPMSVRVDIEVLRSTPVDTGTTASLAFQGITGVAVINLSGEPGMNLPLKKPPGSDHPVIGVRDSGLAALLSDAPALLDKVNRLIDQASELFGPENRARLSGTLENIESVTAALRSQEESFAGMPQRLGATMEDIRALLGEFQASVGNIRPDLESTIDNVALMSANLEALTGRLNTWAESNSEDISDFLDNGVGEFPELLSDARATLRELEKLLQDLRDDPSSLIYPPNRESVDLDD